ncbi:leucine-rich repeat extensin-like protein 5, partial [Terrapene carolina triunguis]|uniref:leucine-rich repeat extensin-like protein 5 n=1 Tax=Terrapene triunguis TaxID=2587831 RepID=UPI0011569D4C
ACSSPSSLPLISLQDLGAKLSCPHFPAPLPLPAPRPPGCSHLQLLAPPAPHTDSLLLPHPFLLSPPPTPSLLPRPTLCPPCSWGAPPSPLCPPQAMEALLVAGLARLVLEEDGTAVESEAFFQTLPPDTALMLLGAGQSWSPPRVSEPSPALHPPIPHTAPTGETPQTHPSPPQPLQWRPPYAPHRGDAEHTNPVRPLRGDPHVLGPHTQRPPHTSCPPYTSAGEPPIPPPHIENPPTAHTGRSPLAPTGTPPLPPPSTPCWQGRLLRPATHSTPNQQGPLPPTKPPTPHTPAPHSHPRTSPVGQGRGCKSLELPPQAAPHSTPCWGTMPPLTPFCPRREVLRVVSAVMQGMGQLLLGASSYIRRLLEGVETWHQPARLSHYED